MSCLSWKEAKVQLILCRLVRAGGCVVVDWALAAQARSPALNLSNCCHFPSSSLSHLPCNTKRIVTYFAHNIDWYRVTLFHFLEIVWHVLRICVSPGQCDMGMGQWRRVGDIPEPELQVEESGCKLNQQKETVYGEIIVLCILALPHLKCWVDELPLRVGLMCAV